MVILHVTLSEENLSNFPYQVSSISIIKYSFSLLVHTHFHFLWLWRVDCVSLLLVINDYRKGIDLIKWDCKYNEAVVSEVCNVIFKWWFCSKSKLGLIRNLLCRKMLNFWVDILGWKIDRKFQHRKKINLKLIKFYFSSFNQ